MADGRVKVIRGPGKGISAALNTGLRSASAPIVMRCDADDVYPRRRIADQVNWLEQHPEYGAVCGGFSTIDDYGNAVAEMFAGDAALDLTEELRSAKVRTHLCTFAMRADVVQKIGGFREFFVTAEDIDFQLRLSRVTTIMYLPQSFYLYRLHEESVTHTQSAERRTYFEKLAYIFQRQWVATGEDDLERGEAPNLTNLAAGPPSTARDQIVGILIGAAWAAHAQGKRIDAIRIGVRALRYRLLSYRAWRSLAALLLKSSR